MKKNYPTFSEIDENIKKQYIKDLKDFITFIKDKLNLSVYLIYGSLLGAMREQDFIAHDTDIDIAYLSNYQNEYEIQKERKDLLNYLDKFKMIRKKETIGIKILYKNSPFDLWTSWTKNNAYYLLPFKKISSKNLLLPFETITFKNEKFLIPNQSKKLLNIIYIDWETIIPKNQNYIKLNTRRVK